MKSLTVAYHDADTDTFGRVQVISESAFPDYSRRGFVEVAVDDKGKTSKVDRDDDLDADEGDNQALRAKVEADAQNAAAEAAMAAAAPKGATKKGGGAPSGSGTTKPGGDA